MNVFPECSLTYVEVEEADRLTRWLTQTFPQLLLVDYEQINPGDTFGRIMANHFASRNSPLRCIQTYPTIDHHKRRFRDIGMTHIEVRTLSEIVSRFGDHQENDATRAEQVNTHLLQWCLNSKDYQDFPILYECQTQLAKVLALS